MALPPASGPRWRLPRPGRHKVVNPVVTPGLVPGTAQTLTYQVQPRDLVSTLFPEAPEFARKPAVLATGILVALCEWPAMDALRQVIRDDEDSLGTGISVSHEAPVSAGTTLTLTAQCVSVTGRASRWDVSAHDGIQTVARGWVGFVVVRTATFLQRHRLTPTASSVVPNVIFQSTHKYTPQHRDLITA
jgi:fluoroacetyl-CoA thioesterase